jgi:hypothetical protein
MANDINRVYMIARLTRDPELKYTQAGTSVASFSRDKKGGGMKAEKIIELFSKKVGLKLKKDGDDYLFIDPCGCTETSKTESEAVEILYGEAFAEGVTSGRKSAAEEIINVARLI